MFTLSKKKSTLNDLDTNLNEIYSNIRSVPSYSSKITDFLRRNPSKSLFKQVRRKFPRRKIRAFYPFHIMMSDTINYRNYAFPANRHFKYIMVLIDVFSKKAWAQPMKRMTEIDSTIAMQTMIDQLPDLPKIIITDLGTEYYNSKMNNLMIQFGIKHYSLRGPHKACVAERFIRTLKGRLEKYFWDKRTRNWVDVLQQFISNYNNTYHRSIKMAPNEVNDENRRQIFETLYPDVKELTATRLKKGDLVRILVNKNIFEKGYT